MKRLAILVPLISLMACGQGGPSYMPLVDDKEWTYSVTSPFQSNIIKMGVGKHVSVGGFDGRTLASELGETRLAWDRKRLVASMLANTNFIPPIPLLVADKIPERKKNREAEFASVELWQGTFESLGRVRRAKATLSERMSPLQIKNEEIETVETVLRVELEGAKEDVPLEIRTWFSRKDGIVRQEQRTNRLLIVSMELLR